MSVRALTLVGAGLLAPYTYRAATFVWFYCFRPSTIRKFLHGPAPAWALVTGASDGIGKAVAAELYDQGFNLVLHGRREERLRVVADELRARPGAPRDVRYFVADASAPGHDFAALTAPFRDLNITVVVQNVGGSPVNRARVDGWSEDSLAGVVRINALFALFLTRALLPGLRASATHGPVAVQFIGSLAADMPAPCMPLYAAAKAFVRTLAGGLDLDERAGAGGPTGVRITYLHVGTVCSGAMQAAPSRWMPRAETFARALVSRVGCGRTEYAPWMWHAVNAWTIRVLGQGYRESVATNATEVFFKTVEKMQQGSG